MLKLAVNSFIGTLETIYDLGSVKLTIDNKTYLMSSLVHDFNTLSCDLEEEVDKEAAFLRPPE